MHGILNDLIKKVAAGARIFSSRVFGRAPWCSTPRFNHNNWCIRIQMTSCIEIQSACAALPNCTYTQSKRASTPINYLMLICALELHAGALHRIGIVLMHKRADSNNSILRSLRLKSRAHCLRCVRFPYATCMCAFCILCAGGSKQWALGDDGMARIFIIISFWSG